MPRHLATPVLTWLVACSPAPTDKAADPDTDAVVDSAVADTVDTDIDAETDTDLDSDTMADTDDSIAPLECLPCPTYGTPEDRGELPAMLKETSGLAASRKNPGILYAHNDSGDSARIIAVDDHGALVAELRLDDVDHDDFEDIAVGPCPSGTCIYVGDIGDNGHNRWTKTVWRFEEPTLVAGQHADPITLTGGIGFRFKYPGILSFPNAETLLVHPTTGDIYVVTKEDDDVHSRVFVFPTPYQPNAVATLRKVATLPFPNANEPDVSGGDIHPCGTAVAFRVSNHAVRQMVLTPGQDFDAVFKAATSTTRDLPNPAEGNAEAIAWATDGSGYFTAAEGSPSMLHYVGCAP